MINNSAFIAGEIQLDNESKFEVHGCKPLSTLEEILSMRVVG